MHKNVASQKIELFAFIPSTGLPKTGDAAQITAYVSKDHGAVTVLGDTSATEMDATNAKGIYLFDLTQGETNGDELTFSAKSSTSDVSIVPRFISTNPANFTAWLTPLVPTVAGRTLDVSAGGEAGLDWANVGAPTTSLALTGTTIAVTQKVDVDTIKTNPVVNAGTVTFPTTATLASTTNITAGTVATATNVTTVNGLAANVITSSALATSAVDEIVDQVWDEVLSGHLTAGTTGAGLNAAGSAGDPWSTAIPGAYGSGTAGHRLGNVPDLVAGAAGGLFIAGTNAATTVAITGNITGNLSGSVGSVTGAVGSVTGAVGSVTGSTGSISGVTFPTNFSSMSIDANGRVRIQTSVTKNTALAGFTFIMTDSTTHAPKTGLTVTSQKSLNGGAFAACTNSATEVANGEYSIDLSTSDMNGNSVMLRFTATAADDLFIELLTTS